MAEEWVECPALGPGWKRREAFRKSGATCGRTDTYYQSPTGEKFRSKIELSRFLGPSRDLGNFDFKNGLERSGPPKGRKGPKWRPPSGPPPEPPPVPPLPPLSPPPPPPTEEKAEEEGEVGGATAAEAPPPAPEAPPLTEETPPAALVATPPRAEAPPSHAEAPPPADPPLLPARRTRKRAPPEPPQEGVVACCAGCQRLFPGVTLPPQRRCRWLCPACRAQRRDFNREQRFFKRVGCGSCQACRIPADCGICSACARPGPPPGPSPAPPPKCLLRRCLRIVKKGLGCGSCPGCLTTEDCGSCCICLRRLKPGLKRQWRCLRRRCLRPKKVAKKNTYGPRKLKWKSPLEREPSAAPTTRHRKQLNKVKEKKKPGRPPKHPGTRGGGGRGARSRASRRCGACEACLRPGDCGRCDFCRDKPKFGGQNLKRQKCRWRQCLRCAMDKEPLMGGAEKGPGGALLGPPLRLPPLKEEPGPLPHLQDPRLGLLIASAPRLKPAPPEPSGPPGPPPPGDLGVLIAATPRLKQEPPQPGASLVPMPPRFPPARLVPLDESEEEEEEGRSRVPLPLPPPPLCWPGAFLAELAEIPLPAHWGVMMTTGDEGACSPPSPPTLPGASPPPPPAPRGAPGLRLVQRSPRSPMAATVVLLAPGLAFRVLVARRRPVPPGHEVLTRRPPRLRSVDDLVELLCDLEAYRPCPGPPGAPPRAPAPRCQVLVPGGRCCRPCLLLGGGTD